MHKADTRRAWWIGATNAILTIVIVNLAYTMLSSGGLYLIPWWVAVPYGALVAWRGAVFVKALQAGRARMWQPPVEGFLVLFVSAVLVLATGILRAHLAGVPPVGWGWDFWSLAIGYTLIYSVPLGLFGALVAYGLMTLDVLLVDSTQLSRKGARRPLAS